MKTNNVYALFLSIFLSIVLISSTQIFAYENKLNTEKLAINDEHKNIVFNIIEYEDKNVVSYLDNGKYNIIEYYKESGKLTLSNNLVSTKEKNEDTKTYNTINENNTSLKAVKKTYVKTIYGSLNLASLANKLLIIAAITSVTGPAGLASASSIAGVILASGIKRLYYSQLIYRSKNNNTNNGSYKYSSTFKFYKDSKRTKHLFTV